MRKNTNARNAPYILVAPSSRRIMWNVLAALIPGILALCLLEGSRWLGNLAAALLTATVTEALLLKIRAKPHIAATITDGSALLTGALLALALPVSAPAWLIMLATAFAILIGKQLYGGLGMNPFNPAMVGFAFALVSFPALAGQYPAGALPLASLWQPIDSLSAATLLDASRTLRINGEVPTPAFPFPLIAVNLAWLAGAAYLIYKRYADWRIVAAVLLGIILTAAAFWLYDPRQYLNPAVQLLAGASIFGACFIATDPVTAPATPHGRWIYGALIGILTICIRNLGNFPDGVAFAVLIANALVPLLDPLTRPHYR